MRCRCSSLAALYLRGLALLPRSRERGRSASDSRSRSSSRASGSPRPSSASGCSSRASRSPASAGLARRRSCSLALPLVVVARTGAIRLLVTRTCAAPARPRALLAPRPGARARVGRLSHRLLDADGAGRDRARAPGRARGALRARRREPRARRGGRPARPGRRRRATGDATTSALIGQAVSISSTSRPASAPRCARRAAFAVFDAETSPIVNQRLNEIARVKSCAFVPVRRPRRVIGVVFAAVRRPRLFELRRARADADARVRGGTGARADTLSAAALAEALERERLIARISLDVRSRRELDELLPSRSRRRRGRSRRCAASSGSASRASRTPVLAEWAADGVAAARRREPPARASNLAVRERRTVAIGDVLEAPELDDPTLGDSSELTDRGVRAVLATPIVAFDRVIGVLGLHRAEPAKLDAEPRSRSPRPSPARRRSRSTRAGCSARATAGSRSSRRSSRRARR